MTSITNKIVRSIGQAIKFEIGLLLGTIFGASVATLTTWIVLSNIK